IIENIKKYLAQEKEKKIDVQVLAVEVQRGTAKYTDTDMKTQISASGVDGEVIFGKFQKIKIDAQKITVKKEGWPEVSAGVSSVLQVKDGTVAIQKLQVNSLGSKFAGKGEYAEDGLKIRSTLKLLFKSFKEMFQLESSGEGQIDAKGDITYRNKKISLDMKVAGEFYLQTLMEILGVEEKIEGLVSVKGEIRGQLDSIRGVGTATLLKGNLYGVDIDFLKSAVSYADGHLDFTDARGKLYRGQARASASIALPVVDFFSLDIDFFDADSRPLFELIGWNPGIQPGKVTGTLHSSGREFNPAGRFTYTSTQKGSDVLGRVRYIDGAYSMNGQLLALNEIKISSEKSDISGGGIVDTERKTLDIDYALKSGDVTDLSVPYYSKLQGKGEVYGKLGGSFDDPVISGKAKIKDFVIEGYPAGSMDANINYRKDLLHVSELVLQRGDELHRIEGDIYFKSAKNLFELSGAEFKLRAFFRNAALGEFVRIFYPDFKATGRFSSELNIRGTKDRPYIKGKVALDAASLYDVAFDSGTLELRYADQKLDLTQAKIKKGKSLVTGNFSLSPDKRFSYSAFSDSVMISDLIPVPIQGDAAFSVKTEGSGTFDNPTILVDAQLKEGVLKGKQIGKGVVKASIRDKAIEVKARLIDEKLSVDAKGRMEADFPWKAKVDIKTGRYDFLIASFLKDVPEDLMVSLNGSIELHGTKKYISASSKIEHLVLSMYGYSFTNEDEMLMELNGKKLSFNTFSLRSGNTLLRVGGSLVIGSEYNLSFEGSSSLSPFKTLSRKLGLLKGNADFVMEITGDWDSPRIYGGMTLEDGAIGLKDYPQRISSLNGYLYVDNDKVVLQGLSGKVGGGDIDISGILYLKKFSFKRFYVEAKLANITTSVSKNFSVNFGGNILYKGTPEAQIVSGDITINNARYRERVEWKSWLLKAKATEKIKSEISNLEKAELNIKIAAKNNISVDNNVARAVFSADMVLRGTIYRPILFGRLETSEGAVYFRNNQFDILHASADFADPRRINPVFEISAETAVKGYRIKLNLEGQLEHFNMSLSSDPPLKEMDVLALLTVGQTSGELKGLEGGVGASEATSFVTGKMQDVMEERLKSITGLDRFQIDPYVSKSSGTVEPRVTVSKRLLSEKMFVTYTTSVGTIEEQIIKVEYFMGKNVSLIGVRDERGILGGDIRFRFEFK
ncbi:MAG: translocation/assembly module TamB domain-containing protein, partial [Nitrospirota bacterium]|nr:translocation/assembly module TamB domain-containing protein [Nitrospirota bacterium]